MTICIHQITIRSRKISSNNLAKVSHVATAFSAVMSFLAVAVAAFQYYQFEQDKKTEDWQKVVVYKYVLEEENPVNFNQIKSNYVANAQQLRSFDLEEESIQDDALRKVLLDLQSSGVIQMVKDEKFEPVVEKTSVAMTLMRDMLIQQKLTPDYKDYVELQQIIFDELSFEGNCYKYTPDTLWAKISNSKKLKFNQASFLETLHSMRPHLVLFRADGKLCLNYDS